METLNLFRRFFLAIAVLASSFVIVSCDKDDDDDDMNDETYAVSGNASGAQENPAVTSNGTATLSGSYNASINKLDFTVNWTGLSGTVTMMHFHGPAAVGVNAGILIDLGSYITSNGITGSASGSVTLTDANEVHLLNGNMYYNLHTALHVAGEIRGQVTATPN